MEKEQLSPTANFVVCLNNEGYQASLEVGKLYRFILDKEAEAHGLIRVVDESGEDYGYSKDRFFPIEVPEALEKTLLGALNEVTHIS